MRTALPDDWYVTERGNTLLVNTDGDTPKFVAYIGLPEGKLLEIALTPENYPCLELSLTDDDDRLSAHLDKLQDDGWHARKRNHGGEYKDPWARLAKLAETNGWTALKLQELYYYHTDELGPGERSVEGLIRKAIEDGDDVEWIRETVSQPPATGGNDDG